MAYPWRFLPARALQECFAWQFTQQMGELDFSFEVPPTVLGQ